jgi:fluoride ion exporter CrcB/FEX
MLHGCREIDGEDRPKVPPDQRSVVQVSVTASVVGAYTTWSSFPVEVGSVVVSSAMDVSLR